MSTGLPAAVNLTAYHGDTWTQVFRLRLGATPQDLTGATVAAWAKSSVGAIVHLAALIVDPVAGLIEIGIGPDGLPSGTYAYDVQITQTATVVTWIRGSLVVTADITDPVTP